MPIKVNGSSSGSVTLAAPASGSDVTVTLPGSAGTLLNEPGAWTSYTPTTFGITVGNGTLVGKYVRIGKFVAGYITFTMGSTSSISGNLVFMTPTTAVANSMQYSAFAVDNGVNAYPMTIDQDGAYLYLRAINTASTYAVVAFTSSTVPFTWGSGDYVRIAFSYEEA